MSENSLSKSFDTIKSDLLKEYSVISSTAGTTNAPDENFSRYHIKKIDEAICAIAYQMKWQNEQISYLTYLMTNGKISIGGSGSGSGSGSGNGSGSGGGVPLYDNSSYDDSSYDDSSEDEPTTHLYTGNSFVDISFDGKTIIFSLANDKPVSEIDVSLYHPTSIANDSITYEKCSRTSEWEFDDITIQGLHNTSTCSTFYLECENYSTGLHKDPLACEYGEVLKLTFNEYIGDNIDLYISFDLWFTDSPDHSDALIGLNRLTVNKEFNMASLYEQYNGQMYFTDTDNCAIYQRTREDTYKLVRLVEDVDDFCLKDEINRLPVTEIGEYAFKNRTVKTFSWKGARIQKIAENAFAFFTVINGFDCDSHDENYQLNLFIPSTVTTIGECAFSHAMFPNNTCFFFPNTLTSIPDKCFLYCGNMYETPMEKPYTVHPKNKGIYSTDTGESMNTYNSDDIENDIKNDNPHVHMGYGTYASFVVETIWSTGICHMNKFNVCFTLFLEDEDLYDSSYYYNNDFIYDATSIDNSYMNYYGNTNKHALESIGEDVFLGSTVHYVELPYNVQTLGSGCFRYSTIHSVNILNEENFKVVGIPDKCFKRCYYISDRMPLINIKNTQIEEFGKQAFYGTKSWMNPNYDESATANIYPNYDNKMWLEIPETLHTIDDECFMFTHWDLYNYVTGEIIVNYKYIGENAIGWFACIINSLFNIKSYSPVVELDNQHTEDTEGPNNEDDPVTHEVNPDEPTPYSGNEPGGGQGTGQTQQGNIPDPGTDDPVTPVPDGNQSEEKFTLCSGNYTSCLGSNTLSKIKFENNLTWIYKNGDTYIDNYLPDKVFDGADFKTLKLPENTKEIGKNACARLNYVYHIKFPEGLTKIHKEAFFHCPKLQALIIPSTVTHISYLSFANNCHLTDIYVLATTPPQFTEYNFIGNSYDWGDAYDGTEPIYDGPFHTQYHWDTSEYIGNEGYMISGINSKNNPRKTYNLLLNIYVPEASVNAYKTANGWKVYKDIIHGISSTEIENIKQTENELFENWSDTSDTLGYVDYLRPHNV